MPFDLVIKNGMVVDGSGLPAYPADIGVRHGRIDTIGRIRERAREVIDADGLVVAPGFVDGHTHMDAQIFWDPLGTSSCYHGITTVVIGNCGFTLAPCAAANKHLVIQNLQRAEDISPKAMEAGIEWRWTTYPEFLDVLDTLPKGINYAGYVGHSAVRTYVMGERAFDQDVGAHGGVADVAGVVDALGQGIEDVEELRIRGPAPLDPGLHRLRRDVLGALQVLDDQVLVGGGAGGQREAAVAHDDRGDAVVARRGPEGIPEDLGVHVGVAVDEAWRDDEPVGVDDLARPLADAADRIDPAVAHADVGRVRRQTGSIDHHPVLDHQVKRHRGLLSSPGPTWRRERYRTMNAAAPPGV